MTVQARAQRSQACGGLYVIGGFGVGGDVLASVERADPSSGSWEEVPPLAAGRYGSAAAFLGGELYICGGGGNADRSLQRLSAVRGAWEDLPPMSLRRFAPGMVALRGCLYVCGGLDGSGLSLRSLERFCPASGTSGIWGMLPPMREHRHGFVAATVDGRILACGGLIYRSAHQPGALSSMERFDPAGFAWTPVAPMSAARGRHAGAVGGAALYICGGSGPRGAEGWKVFGSAERFDAAAGTWAALPPMCVPRSGAVAAFVADRLFVCGGLHNNEHLSSVEQYDPCTKEWAPGTSMLRSRYMACAGVVEA